MATTTTDPQKQIEQLKLFLATAPTEWHDPTQKIKKLQLPNNETIHCILHRNIFHITGTDIVKCLAFRFQCIGRPVKNAKKFEEGVFSDLRNLKAGTDACLEEPRSEFLEFLYKNNCIRTQKKQKVFYWYSVPHDRLFVDALERDLKREAMGQEPATARSGPFQLPYLARMFNESKMVSNDLMRPAQLQGFTNSPIADLKFEDIMKSPATPIDPTKTFMQQMQRMAAPTEHKPRPQVAIASADSAKQDLFKNPLSGYGLEVTPPLASSTPSLHTPLTARTVSSPDILQHLATPPQAGICLDGSPHYKKQRRRSSIIKSSKFSPPQINPYGRRFTQPAIPAANMGTKASPNNVNTMDFLNFSKSPQLQQQLYTMKENESVFSTPNIGHLTLETSGPALSSPKITGLKTPISSFFSPITPRKLNGKHGDMHDLGLFPPSDNFFHTGLIASPFKVDFESFLS
jgi:hypothetical protein